MLAFKQWLVNTIINDTTMQSLLYKDSSNNYAVFPVDVDIQPEQFPCITYQEIGTAMLSRPIGMHVGTISVNIWSINNALETETIYERLGQLLNYKDSTTQTITGTLWWVREQRVVDMHQSSRRLWHKVVDLKFWVNKSDNT